MHKVARYASVLAAFPTTNDTYDLLNQLRRLFSATMIDQISLLDSLVPEYPASGELAKRNHEYPFQKADGSWCAPCDAESFRQCEIKRIRRCAGVLIRKLRRILDALDLLYS
jgi:hypothetical protein